MRLNSRNGYLLLSPVGEQIEEGAIQLPEDAQRGCVFGKVLVPYGFYRIGDVVIYRESDSELIRYDSEEYRAVLASLVVAILEKTPEELL